MSEEGGESACWLNRVCPDCGALNESPDEVCWRCGGPLGAAGSLGAGSAASGAEGADAVRRAGERDDPASGPSTT